MNDLLLDLRYAIRSLRKNAGFTAVVVLTLAMGIGLNTAIFSMVSVLMFRPIPAADPSLLVIPYAQQKGDRLSNTFSVPDYRDIARARTDVFSSVMASEDLVDGLSYNGNASRALDLYVSGNFFSTLGVQPVLGRFFLSLEADNLLGDPLIVLGYNCWRDRFGSDPRVVGKSVSIDGRAITVIGVAPEGFYGINPWASVDAYLPLGMAPISGADPNDFLTNRKHRNIVVMARLRPGISMEQASSAMRVEAASLSQDHPAENADLRMSLFPEISTRFGDPRSGTLRLVSTLFIVLAVLLLLLACFNAANLLLVRASARRGEMAVRAAIGAGGGRLVRQLLTEGALLAACGGFTGILLGRIVAAAASSINTGSDVPLRLDLIFDARVAAYA